MGYEPSRMDRRLKLHFLFRLIPLCERNYNLVELGPRGTGKSFVIQEISPYCALLTGPTTVANMFGHMNGRQKGMVSIWDVVGFDEVADLQKMPKEVVTTLKTYCESGTFQRGKDSDSGNAGIVMFGNTNQPVDAMVRTGHLFAPMPDVIRDDMAFIDRLHFYLPGWEIPKMRVELFGFAKEMSISNFYVEVSDLLNNKVQGDIGVAFFVAVFSAIRKSQVTAATLILGDMSIQGNIKPVRSLAEPLQVAKDNGAKRALIPIENKRNFLDVDADIVEHVERSFDSGRRACSCGFSSASFKLFSFDWDSPQGLWRIPILSNTTLFRLPDSLGKGRFRRLLEEMGRGAEAERRSEIHLCTRIFRMKSSEFVPGFSATPVAMPPKSIKVSHDRYVRT